MALNFTFGTAQCCIHALILEPKHLLEFVRYNFVTVKNNKQIPTHAQYIFSRRSNWILSKQTKFVLFFSSRRISEERSFSNRKVYEKGSFTRKYFVYIIKIVQSVVKYIENCRAFEVTLK